MNGSDRREGLLAPPLKELTDHEGGGIVAFSSLPFSPGVYNMESLIDSMSPWYRSIVKKKRPYYIVDSFYGRVFRNHFYNSTGVYGTSDRVPPTRLDFLANDGFLRIPERRIPRVRVSSRRSLDSAISELRRLLGPEPIVFRGQTQEYHLSRGPELNTRFYDDPYAIEPSLLPSAARGHGDFQQFAHTWMGILSLWPDSDEGMAWSRLKGASAREYASWSALTATPNFFYFALAIAQHYGLPSAGLDASPNLEIALFFAMNSFVESGEGHARSRRVQSDSRVWPVLYVLAPFRNSAAFDFRLSRPLGLPAVRPDRQEAAFLHSGWGYGLNRVALDLILALYLDPEGDFETAQASKLFPSYRDDPFGRYICQFCSWRDDPEFAGFMSHFRWVD